MNGLDLYGFGRARRCVAALSSIAALLALTCLPAAAQLAFDSGSIGGTGAPGDNGALLLDTPGVVQLDRAQLGQDDGDNVFHFTTIHIAEGVTLRLRADQIGPAPVVFLATGAVTIDGVIDLTGEDGLSNSADAIIPTPAGAGGFPGGVYYPVSNSTLRNGFGPGGGVSQSKPGKSTANSYLLPLIGGSGGVGDYNAQCSGGGGGGAILIASTTSIDFGSNGSIDVTGGRYSCSNTGSGGSGSVRLLAPTIESPPGNPGTIEARYPSATSAPSTGVVRIETTSGQHGLDVEDGSRVTIGRLSPSTVFMPTTPSPVIWVATIDGVEPSAPEFAADYLQPDAQLDTLTTSQVLVRLSSLPDDATTTTNISLYHDIELTSVSPATFEAMGSNPCGRSQADTDANLPPLPAGAVDVREACIDVTFPYGYSSLTIFVDWTIDP